jgi:autotransporter-associated beta strand protein
MNSSRFASGWFALFLLGFGTLLASAPAFGQRPMGTDVSGYQPSINWTTVKNAGVTFAWAKATESTGYTSPDFASQMAGAKSVGIYIGAYHFARPGSNPNLTGANSAQSEAAFFWSVAGSYVTGGGAYLVPMLDWEDTTITNTSLTQSTASQWVIEWCNTVSNYAKANGVTVTPVVYTGTWYSEPGTYPGLNTTVTGLPSWIAAYPECNAQDQCGTPNPQSGGPGSTYPWSTWSIWQYGNTNWSGGDSDVFSGTMAQFQQLFLIGGTNVATTATVYWDPSGLKASPGSGGTGNWDGSTSNWWYSGNSDIIWPADGANAVFAGTAGTVTLAGGESASSLTFSNTGYVIAGSQTLTLNSPGNITVASNATATISCVLGGVAYTVSGGGTLVLNNAGNYSAGETVIGPNTTLQLPSDHPAGNDGVTLNLQDGGIYQDNDTTSGDQFLLPGSAVALLTGGGIFNNPNASLNMTNWITGAGSLTYTGGSAYTLTLTDTTNNYSGGTIVNGPGTLKANAAGTLGTNTGSLTVNGGTLNLNSASHTVGAVTVTGGTLSSGTLTGSSYNGQAGAVSAVLAGSAGLTKTTSGTFTLSGANTYSGITTISGGLLQISADNNLGAAPGSTVANKITLNNGGIGAGLRCTASFTLNANRGITLVGPNGGSIHATSGQTATFPMVITGSGNLGVGAGYTTGYGVSVLSGANNYTGTTTIAAGTLRLGANGTLPYGTPLTIAADNNGSGGGGILDLNGYSQTIGPLASSTGIGGTGTNIPTIKLTGALTILQTNINTTFAGAITGSGGSLTINVPNGGTPGALTLAGANTYTGNTTISGGTLALGATGSINNTPTISIAAGATFDVSAIASYTLSGSTTLSAGGSTKPATINGGTSVSFGSQPLVLSYDGLHPALTISQGVLSLNGNAFTINGSPLAAGVYALVQQASGNIVSAGSYSVTGTAIPAAGVTAAISVSGGNVLLTITDTTAATLNALSPSTYGQPVTFTATVMPTPSGGTVQFYDNSVALGGPVTVSGGSASYTTNGLSVGSHPITAAFSGSAGYGASATSGPSIQQVNLPANNVPVTITNVTMLGDGTLQLSFTGVPGYTYLIESSTNLTPPIAWTSLGTNTADINGLFNFNDPTVTNSSSRYYRTAVQ